MRIYSKAIIFMIAACLLFTLASLTTASVTDISGHWARETIEKWTSSGLASGYPDGSFRPDNRISRAEFVTLVNKAFNKQDREATSEFSDVAPADWYYREVASGQAAGYISGYPDSTFGPGNPISRQEVASIIVKLKGLSANGDSAIQSLTDAGDFPVWSKSSISAVVVHQIMRGYPDGTFRAENFITRAEAIVTLDKALETLTAPSPATPVAFEGIKGSILKDGQPVSGVLVKLFARDGYEVLKEFTTSSDGKYEFAATPGEYDLTASKEDNLGCASGITVTKENTTNRDISLVKGVKVSGTIVDSSGNPFKNVEAVFTTNPTFTTNIDGNGRFSLYLLSNHNYSLRSFIPGQTGQGLKDIAKDIEIGDKDKDLGYVKADFSIISSGGGGGGGGSTTPTTYTVLFDLNYESATGAPANQLVTKNSLATRPTDPTREGYSFGGWYKEASCENAFDFANEKIVAGITLYAKWTQNKTINLSASETEFMVSAGFQTVYFYAEIISDVETLYLVDSNKNILAEMKDDGLYSQSGDDLQNDNVFSCKLDIDTSQENMFVYRAEFEENGTLISNEITVCIIAEFTQEELTDIKAVDDAIELLLDDAQYKQDDINARKNKAEGLITVLCEQELIIADSVFYDVSAYMFSFTYKSGVLGAIYLKDFSDEFNGLSREERASVNQVTYTQSSGTIPIMNTPIDLGDAIILNAFENNSFRRDFYVGIETDWESKGLTTEIDTNVSVDDIKNLRDYEVIVFSGHGVYYTHRYGLLWLQSITEPVWCLNETANVDNDKRYSADLKKKRIVKANNTYYVFPSLIRDSYGENDLGNSFVFSESCEFMGKSGNVVESMPDAFISRSAKAVVGFHNSVYAIYCRELMNGYVTELISGETAQNAFNKAVDENGENHNVWYEETYPDKQVPNVPIAYPLLRGDTLATLFNTNILNGNFEMSMSLTHWNTFGDTRVISKLGDISPTSGAKMAILTTGIGSAEADYLAGTEGSVVFQTIKLAGDVSTLSFDYNVVSEEPEEFVGSEFDDTFKVEILDGDGSVVEQVVLETVNSATWIPVGGINFEDGDDTVYQTGWRNILFDISSYKNQLVTIRFIVFDVGDSIYDTAAVVDNVRLN